MNTRDKGELAEGIILAALLKKGISVSMPFGGTRRYDMIMEEKDGSLLKVQCKMGRLRRGVVLFKTCSTNGFTRKSRDYCGEVDLFMVYCPDNEGIYRVPMGKISKTQTSLRVEPVKNGQSKGILWAKDFEIAG